MKEELLQSLRQGEKILLENEILKEGEILLNARPSFPIKVLNMTSKEPALRSLHSGESAKLGSSLISSPHLLPQKSVEDTASS